MRIRHLLPLLVAGAAAAALAGCGEDAAVSASLDAAVEDAQAGRVDLRTVDGTSYDRLYVFPPYTAPETIRRSIGFASDEAEASASTKSDGHFGLVFVKGDDVVAATRYSRGKVDFSCVRPFHGIPARDAVFVLRRAKGYPGRLATFPDASSAHTSAGDGCPV